jgi:hypothetical protein
MPCEIMPSSIGTQLGSHEISAMPGLGCLRFEFFMSAQISIHHLHYRKVWLDALLLLLCCLLVGTQLFVPPIIGLANNGDFAKVTGWLNLGPDRPWSGFNPTYSRSEKYT